MSSARDGTATKQSQALCDQRVTQLLLGISIFSSVGLASAALNGEYTQTAFEWKLSLWGLHVHPPGPLLWVCFILLLLFAIYYINLTSFSLFSA